MSANKGNQGWVLCPSTRFPGKSYYFNLVTGETMWNPSDVERKLVPPRPNFMGKWHSYPEPDSPPEDNLGPNIWPNYQDYTPFRQPKPIFGQPTFPKYNYNFECMPNTWPQSQPMFGRGYKTPFDLNMPRNPFGSKPYHMNPIETPFEKYYEPNRVGYDRQIFGTKFNSNRPFQEPNLMRQRPFNDNFPTTFYKPFEASKPLFNAPQPTVVPTCKCKCGDNTTEKPAKTGLYRSKSTTNLTEINDLEHNVPILKFKTTDDLPQTVTSSWLQTMGEKEDLSEMDLRHVLLARKRRSVSESSTFEAKKIKTHYTEEKKEKDKKRVTFDLGVEKYNGGNEEDGENLQEGTEDQEFLLLEDRTPDTNKVICFMVVSTDVLLSSFDVIEQYLDSDPSSVLLIPCSVQNEVSELSRGVCAGRRSTVVARQLARKLQQPPANIMLDTEREEKLVEDPILNCCLQAYADGYNVVLITDNEELFTKAVNLEIDSYTTEDLKKELQDFQPVSFDITSPKKTDIIEKIPTNVSRKILFPADNIQNNIVSSATIKENQLTRSIINQQNEKSDLKLTKDIPTLTSQNGQVVNKMAARETNFFRINQPNEDDHNFNEDNELSLDSEIEQVKKLNLNDRKFFREEKVSENDCLNVFQNGVKNNVARIKNKNINVYSLNEHLKSFYVKDKLMEDRVKNRFDEYFCVFQQIMESTLMGVFQETLIYALTHTVKLPLKEMLECIRDEVDDRTVTAIVDKLCLALDAGFQVVAKDRVVFCKRPDDFMKMLGLGTLLVICLETHYPNNEDLSQSESLLLQLVQDIEDGDEHLEVPVPAPSRDPNDFSSYKPEFVKQPSYVLEYLKKHFVAWANYNPSDNFQVKIQENPTIIRTNGKNLGLLKFRKIKQITLNNDNRNQTEVNTENKKEEIITTGPKLIRKLAMDSLNIPPKMKEIDLEKREKVNKEMLSMIEGMTSKNMKAPTKFYNLNSVIVDTSKNTVLNNLNDLKISDRNQNNKYDSNIKQINTNIGNTKDINTNIGNTKENTNKLKINIVQTNYGHAIYGNTNTGNTKYTNTNNGNTKPLTRDSEKNEKQNLIDITKERYENLKNNGPLDLDILDYSAISTDESESKLEIVENEQEIQDGRSRIQNGERDRQDGVDECNDSGIESLNGEQTYFFVQKFLKELITTYFIVFDFIVSTSKELKKELPDERKKQIYDTLKPLQEYTKQMIEKLILVIERETNEQTSVTPLILKFCKAAAEDKRITRYRHVITKCLEQAKLLKKSLKSIEQVVTGGCCTNSISSNNSEIEYFNIFE